MNATDAPEVLGPGKWRMWALRVSSPPYGGEFYEPGHRRYAEMYRGKNDEPAVEVLVAENEDGPYYGWLATGEEIPLMIHATEGLFRMCFAYGPQAEVDHGKGRIVRLAITELENGGGR